MSQILGRGPFWHLHPWASPKRPILNRVKVKFGTQTHSNLQNLMVMFTFLILERILLLRKFDPKIQDGLFVWSEIWYLDYLEYVKFDYDVHFAYFTPEITFTGKFGLKNQNCLFKLKFGTWTNSNVPHSMVVDTFFCFRPELSILDKFCRKI